MINEIRQEILLSSELRRKINWVIKYTSSNVNIINEAYESSKNMLNTNHINSVLSGAYFLLSSIIPLISTFGSIIFPSLINSFK